VPLAWLGDFGEQAEIRGYAGLTARFWRLAQFARAASGQAATRQAQNQPMGITRSYCPVRNLPRTEQDATSVVLNSRRVKSITLCIKL
jgi:hypothetical protein